jgi:nucleotide-binding universal stress UspA family protein
MSALANHPHGTSAKNDSCERSQQDDPPIVAAVDGSGASRAPIGEAVRLAGELSAPIAFVYVRRGPAGFFGAPVYQRRLTKEMARARRALDRALAVANGAGVQAEGAILEGSPRRRITEFARDRGARLIVVGSRGRKLRQSVSTAVIRAAECPVIVARVCSGSDCSGVATGRPLAVTARHRARDTNVKAAGP